MPDERPRRSRYIVEDHLSSLRFIIKGRKNWPIVIFLGIWLIGWGVGEVVVAGILFSSLPDLSGDNWFLVFWLTFWTAGGAGALHGWFQAFTSREIVDVNAETLSIKQSVLGIGRRREYAAPYVDNLRIAPNYKSSSGRSGHCLTFNYGGDVVQWGASLSKAEAEEMLALIQSRFPDLTKGVEEV